jgi:hypothetical protein
MKITSDSAVYSVTQTVTYSGSTPSVTLSRTIQQGVANTVAPAVPTSYKPWGA